MPSFSLETVALWVELPDRFTDLVEKHDLNFAGGIHAIEHAMIAMYPLRLLADRNDVGGVSTPSHCDLNGKCGIFVYDGHRGGVGYAEKGYEIITDILDVTLKAIEGCPCSDGCPSCIQSPKCGNHNNPLDKHAALIILHELLGKPPYIPKKARPQKSQVPQEKPEKHVGVGGALDRVRRQLRRDALKLKESIIGGISPNDKKPVTPEEKKIIDKIKQIEELQKRHELKKQK
jgi:DEAD/DEAH box helicase domain-containing protein